MGVGGAFDFITGLVPRAPAWVQRIGLEHFYRLLRQPWRWRRQVDVYRFGLLVLWRGIKVRIS
jgi:N-acetylglucosaminyldiphosphoundecaprenol N-acetyl-beta-D-mannosaminyltransferase